ncbi:MAG: hypothetical protein ACLRFK_03700 [Alphaproteobacteria bacterium]
MNKIDIRQQINALEQELLAANEKVADLEKKIQERRVGLSFNAVGKTDSIYAFEVDLDNTIQEQMRKKRMLAVLRAQLHR